MDDDTFNEDLIENEAELETEEDEDEERDF